jgi:hypothetical protein
MKPMDVWITWGEMRESVRSAFQRPTHFVDLPIPPNRAYNDQVKQRYGWPNPLVGKSRGLLTQLRAQGIEPQRVGVSGFSETCQGARAFLWSKDAQLFDSVFACDGAHGAYIEGSRPKRVNPAFAGPWVSFGAMAAFGPPPTAPMPGKRLMVMSHSSIVPGAYASTTEIADEVIGKLFDGGLSLPQEAAEVPYWLKGHAPWSYGPGALPKAMGGAKYPRTEYTSVPLSRYIAYQNLFIIGCRNLDPTGIGDHAYQANVLFPRVARELIAYRWNVYDPGGPYCAALTDEVYKG